MKSRPFVSAILLPVAVAVIHDQSGDQKEMKAADKAEENKLRAEAAHKRALSD
jgi:hypothetical protein